MVWKLLQLKVEADWATICKVYRQGGEGVKMEYIKKVAASAFMALVALGLMAGTAQAVVTLDVNGSGQLTGAQGVVIEGRTYNIEIGDGICSTLFSGCDAVTDFDFQTLASATIAAEAVLNQVLLHPDATLFDASPELVFGIEDDFQSHWMIPYLIPISTSFQFRSVVNVTTFNHAAGIGALSKAQDSATVSTHTFIKFTETSVPEPTTLALFGLALFGLGAARKRRQSN
jgi:hypothetical protein